MTPSSPKRYIGKPCKKCGGRERYRSTWSCVRCVDERKNARKKTPEFKASVKAYWMKKRYGISPSRQQPC